MRLLGLNEQQTKELIDQMEAEINSIDTNIFNMAWHMRGGITYDQLLMLSFKQLESINKIIGEHMEVTGKSNLPFF